MNSWKVILATLIIFGTGVVTGGLLVNYAIHTNASPRPAPGQGLQGQAVTPWLARAHDLLRRMDRDLDLTPEQHKRIEKLIAESAERTKALWKPIAPQMNKEMQILHRDIREELTPEQRRTFDELFKGRGVQQNRRFGTNQQPPMQTNAVPVNP